MSIGMKRALALALTFSLTAAAAAGCGASTPPPGGSGASVSALSGGPPSSFRSYNVPPITAANGIDCTTLRGTTSTAKRPMCAKTTFILPNHCLILGARSGCQCVEGEAHACTPPNGTTPCPSGTGCGIRPCLVSSDSSSTWSSTCYAL